MRKIFYLVCSLVLLACSHKDAEHEHEHEANEVEASARDEGHNDNEIVFTQKQAEAAGLRVETVEAGEFREGIKTSGQVLSAQDDDQVLVARSAGVVTFVRKSLVEGAAVLAEETLISISAEGMEGGDTKSATEMELAMATKEYERAVALAVDRIVAQSEVDRLRLRVETLKAQLASGAAANASNSKVKAPFKGYVKRLVVRPGDYVAAGAPLAVLTKNRRLQLRAEVSERYYSHLHHISGANFRLTGSEETLSVEELGGRLISYGRSTASDVCFVPVVFEFDNVGDIVSGSFCDVYMLGEKRDNVISVPISALTEDQGLFYVYVQLDEEGYEKREVTLGETDGLRREITKGLKAGEKVVVEGATQVKLAGMAGVIPAHSHNH